MKKPKFSVDEIVESIDTLSAEEKEKYGRSRCIFVPVIRCTDGVIIPVKDTTGLSTGTFACQLTNGDSLLIKPERKKR